MKLQDWPWVVLGLAALYLGWHLHVWYSVGWRVVGQ